MKATRFARVIAVSVAAMFLVGLLAPAAPAQQAFDPAKAMPQDTFLLLYAKDLTGLWDKFQKTGWYGLYKDPAMQSTVVPAEKKIRELFEKQMAEGWSNLKIENPPKELPLPQGVVGLGMKMQLRTINVPEYDFSGEWQPGGPPPIKGTRQIQRPEPAVVGFFDMGKNIDAVKDLVKQLTDKAQDQGYTRQTETVRGVDVTVIAPPAPKEPSPWSHEEPVCLAFKDSLAMVSNDEAFLKDIVARLGGSGSEALADDSNFKTAMKGVDGDKGDVVFYLSLPAILLTARQAETGESRAEMEKVFGVLNLDQITGIGAAMFLAPADNLDMRIKGMVGVKGPRSGLMEVLTPNSAPVKLPRILTKDVVSFAMANYDAGEVFDRIIKMAEAISGENIGENMKEAMAMTGEGVQGGKPPVDLRKDVLGQLTAPVTLGFRLNKPINEKSLSMVVGVGVRDGAALDRALDRIHATFIAQGRKEMKREFNGVNIYMLPGGGLLSMIMPFGGRGFDEQPSDSFAIAGDTLVFGSVEAVEQAIRDVSAKPESLADDAMYQAAAKFLPAQAGLVSYENQQASMEPFWVQLMQMGKQAKSDGAVEPDETRYSGPRLKGSTSMPSSSAMGMIARGMDIEELIDLSTLPEYEKVKKYFGASVSYLVGTDAGLLFESAAMKGSAK